MVDVGCEVLFLADRLAGRSTIQTLRNLVDGLQGLGHDSTVLCLSAPSDHGIDDLEECPGLGRRWQRPWSVRGLDLGIDGSRARLMHVLSAKMADVALAIAERWRIPYLLGVEEFPRRDFRLRLSRAWCRGLVVGNRELAAALTRDYGVPGELMHVVAGSLTVPAPTDRLGDPGRVPVVGAAGPLVASSGFATFLAAARKVTDAGFDVEYLIAGIGEDEGDLRRKAERLRIADRLTFADDLPIGLSFWRVLDIYCQTSLVPTVGVPLRMAMAGGVPSISTDVEGLRALVEPGRTGLVVPHGDASTLAAAILELLEDPERSRQLGDAARLFGSAELDSSREVASLDALYRSVTRGEVRPSALDDGRIAGSLADTRGREAGVAEPDTFPRLSRAPGSPSDRS